MAMDKDLDTLLLLQRNLDWEGLEQLYGKVDSETLSLLREIEELHIGVSQRVTPRAGFIDEVMATSGASNASHPRESPPVLAAYGFICSLACFVAVVTILKPTLNLSIVLYLAAVSSVFGITSAITVVLGGGHGSTDEGRGWLRLLGS